ncbi:MAG: hypothetical protein KDD51_08345 [Bdellovibrionales bacterium]|nr:hypothetical protein [Bdellovibrionales bacterium]
MFLRVSCLVFLLGISLLARADEQSLDLETEQPLEVNRPVQSTGPRLMGRADLTVDVSEVNHTGGSTPFQFKNYHFFLFLKAQASTKVTFFAEFVGRYFYEIKYSPWTWLSIHLGKIIVPFGNTDNFHHLYGGTSINASGSGIMFPNIWAASGIQTEWGIGDHSTLDVYALSGINAAVGSDPDFTNPAGKTPAAGIRWTSRLLSGLKVLGSFYYETWSSGKSLFLAGLDASTDYSLLASVAVLKHFRLGMGAAIGFIERGSSGDFHKYGDYIELASNVIRLGELRARYGTYVNNNRVKSSLDSQSLNVAWLVPIDVMKLMVEYQWNFEAINEIHNDLLRVMVSLDF